jgi:NitT/TauT family transport system ATP-binding protein
VSEIILDGVSKRYRTRAGEFVAIVETSLTVRSEETVCIVGASGCGKTTLLNMIAGFVRPTTGSVSVGGQHVSGPGADRAVVFQADAVFPWLTVRQNLEYGPRVRRLEPRKWKPRVDRYLTAVGLEEFANAYPKALSGGMKKRVDLARAYVNDPDILLMDEPYGALDVLTKESMQTELMTISAGERKTIVFVTHDIEEAIFLGDRIVVMGSGPGRIEADIPVTFPRQRTLAVRATPEFQAMRQHIGLLLREASGR